MFHAIPWSVKSSSSGNVEYVCRPARQQESFEQFKEAPCVSESIPGAAQRPCDPFAL